MMASLALPSFMYFSPRVKAPCFLASGVWAHDTAATRASPTMSRIPQARLFWPTGFIVRPPSCLILLGPDGACRKARGRVLGTDGLHAGLDVGCVCRPIHFPQQARIALEVSHELRSLGPPSFLHDCQRAFQKGFGFRVPALVTINPCEIAEHPSDLNDVRSERLLQDRQRSLINCFGFCSPTLALVRSAQMA